MTDRAQDVGVLERERFACDCGWKGARDGCRTNARGILACPSCWRNGYDRTPALSATQKER